jgi:sulfur carrier protein ThiS
MAGCSARTATYADYRPIWRERAIMIRVNGEALDYTPGMTVEDVLKLTGYPYSTPSVWIDGTLVPMTAFTITVVPDGADVEVLHMIVGG